MTEFPQSSPETVGSSSRWFLRHLKRERGDRARQYRVQMRGIVVEKDFRDSFTFDGISLVSKQQGKESGVVGTRLGYTNLVGGRIIERE